MITEQQKNNIHKLSTDDCIEIIDECINRAGICSVKEYKEATGIPERTIYHMMNTGKLKYYQIGNSKFPILNT